jgi:hypothetical protein
VVSEVVEVVVAIGLFMVQAAQADLVAEEAEAEAYPVPSVDLAAVMVELQVAAVDWGQAGPYSSVKAPR